MQDRPRAHLFVLALVGCAAAVIALAVTGAGGFPLLVATALVGLGTVDACFRSFDARHRAARVAHRTGAHGAAS